MVRPISSKRKLFNSNKYQFKENEPSQIKTGESNSVSSYPYSSSTQFPRAKPINYAKRSLSDSTDCDKKQECTTKSTVDGLKKCNSENAVDALAPSRIVMPMSERQQIALVMQLSSPSPTGKSEDLSCNTPSTPTTPLLGRGLAKRNERGETLLHVAAIKGDCEKVAQLISQGANVNAADYAGWTALHEACNRGFITIASLLIKGGADVNAKGFDNDTPLHDACVNNHYQIVRLLLTSGAKPDFVNSRGKSPFDICRSPKVLILLEEAKLGKLEPTEISTSISSKVSVQEIEQILCELGFVSLNNNWPSIEASETVPSMSRKTPPNNKAEEKLSPQVSVASPTTGASSSAPASVSGSTASSASNSRPVSPRIPMRLQHGTRTPDKVSNLGGKNSSESDDVYEFRCSKDDSKEGETTEKTAEPTSTKSPDPTLATPDTKSEKRLRDSEQTEEEDESKKKRKKEDNKEGVKGNARGAGSSSRPSTADKFSKVNQRPSSNNGKNQSPNLHSTTTTSSAITTSSTASSNSSSTCSTTLSASMEQKKSPSNSASNSPKPPCSMPTTKTDKNDSDNEELKHDSNPWAPKVPPLKIVLAPCSLSEQETNSQTGKNTNGRQLPYVVNSSSGSVEDKEKEGSSADSSSKESTVLKDEASTKDSTKGYSPLPVVTSSSSPTPTTTASATTTTPAVPTLSDNSPGSVANSPSSSSCSNNNSGNNGTSTASAVTSDKGSATRVTRSQRGGGNSGSSSNSDDGQIPSVKIEPKTEDPPLTTPEVIHPRKRKIKMKESEAEPCPPPTATPEQPQLHISNGYEMFLKIRKQIERRRKLLFPVQPKPPQGFKDYLMNRCSYVLANNANSHLAVPIISPPSTLPQPLKDLFSEQEQERYKLRLQQLIEKEKLVLSVEQEILRVHGRAARALANQVLPFSVCTILKDEEVYNVISPEQEDKERNARSRYNGRLFLSWLQDVDDKWEKIKEAMVLRHHNEAESLHAVQKMDWEWKLKELGMVEANMRTSVDDLHVPMVQVADFDLLPA